MTMLIKNNNDSTLSKERVNTIGVVPNTQVTHVRKNSNIQGRSLNVIKVIFHTIKKRLRSLDQILSFKNLMCVTFQLRR